jgi:hypothetical protein
MTARGSNNPEGTLSTPQATSCRALFIDDRGGALRVTWHAAKGIVVLSFWRSDVCIGTCRLNFQDAVRLSGFLAAQTAGSPAGSSDSV